MSRASTRANLLMLQGWIHHWEGDAACNLTPTPNSFASAKLILERLLQEIDAPEKEDAA